MSDSYYAVIVCDSFFHEKYDLGEYSDKTETEVAAKGASLEDENVYQVCKVINKYDPRFGGYCFDDIIYICAHTRMANGWNRSKDESD